MRPLWQKLSLRALRVVAATLLLAGCGGASETSTPAKQENDALFAVDLEAWEASAPSEQQDAITEPATRNRTGDIPRRQLDRVLANGPGHFLRQLEVEPVHVQGTFVGHRILRVAPGPLQHVDAVPGDIVLSVNDLPIGTPADFQRLWESLRTAVVVRAWIERGGERHELIFRVLD